jgi:hypothetical protein
MMANERIKSFLLCISCISSLLIFVGCAKKKPSTNQEEQIQMQTPPEEITEEKKKKAVSLDENELDFEVQNVTGKTIYITCFSYIKKQDFARWRWDKSKVYELKNHEAAIIDIDTIPDKVGRKHVFGTLAVFNTKQEADDAIYELTDDSLKVDLDVLYKLKHKKVVIGIERYGFKGERIDYEFIKKFVPKETVPELDFVIKNNTNKTTYMTCFIYQRKGANPVWGFDKTPVVRLEPGQQTLIDVDTIASSYDRQYMRGYLGVFDEDEEQKAKEVTYELLPVRNKVKLGALFALKNKQVIIEPEKYGIIGDIIDYTIKPIRRIDFTKVAEPDFKKRVRKIERKAAEPERIKVWR